MQHKAYEADDSRRSFIGASESAALLGLSEFDQALDVYNAKVFGESKDETDLMKMGKLFEGPILSIYEDRTGWSVSPNNNTIFHPEYQFIAATPDALVETPAGLVFPLDAKNSSKYRYGWGNEGTDEVPIDIYVQMQHQMLVVDAPRADVAALMDGRRLLIFTIEASAEIQQAIIDGCTEMWERIQNLDPPDIDYECKSCKDILGKMHPKTEDKVVELPAVLQQAWAERQEFKRQIKKLQDEVEKRDWMIEWFLGGEGAQVGNINDDYQVNWKLRKRAGYTVDACEYLELRETKRNKK